MQGSDQDDTIYLKLRTLTVTDPREARAFINELLDRNDPGVDGLLRRISAPGEGRARQVVVNAIRPRQDKDRLTPVLLRWREVEVDEFTKGAIAAALIGIDPSMHIAAPGSSDLPDVVDTYRYVADRLCHRLRNAISKPSMLLSKLRVITEKMQETSVRGELLVTANQILDAFRQVSRLVEFDVSDEYFQRRPIALMDWIIGFNSRYSATQGPVAVTVTEHPTGSKLRILANEQHLETIFLNLWNNSTQAVQMQGEADVACHICVDIRPEASQRVEVLLMDNGPGIPEHLTDTLFGMSFSTKGEGRGRGLLEVQDAVRQLCGTVRLVQVQHGEYRVMMSFPLEKA